jgi:hypothetical protein
MDPEADCPDSIGMLYGPEGPHCGNVVRGFSLVLQN